MPPPPYTVRPASVLYAGLSFVSSASDDGDGSATGSSSTSCGASMPYGFWMLRPDGVYQRAVVIFSQFSPDSGNSVWTEPLPYVVRPSTSARSWSCSAPATISDADALFGSTSTTIGRPGNSSGVRACAL